ncbi:hypothetical protein FSARC_8929 [Fusarium sarcochroum]|uniref:Trichothecene 3-O-acetyltransferase-like N-terminal domain-containing protein n=1 Tax=Fusarium sarcochroum TaxID=1208366 RepID=A0A8H4X6L6_9HYPO|nr:hypothetical protein FSARC_8929 [Fusarium sarcochroum]
MDALSITNVHDLDIELDVIGQQPLMRIYTQVSFCFPVTDPSIHPTIIGTFNQGLRRLSQSFPWVAGQVKCENTTEGGSGIFKIKAFEETPRLVVKDLCNDPSAPTMEGLRKAEFPISMFDENVIAARKTLPIGPNHSPDDPEPVLLFQLNFIEGGLILTVNGQHACMDMTGQDELIRLLSKACRNEAFTQEEISTMNLERKTIVPLLDNYEVGPELDHQLIKPPPTTERPPSPPKASWAYFSFGPQALSELKDVATQTLDASTKFVSTDDALSAFIWQSVTRARLPRLDASTSTQFCRAVDVRTQLDVPKNYPGILQNMTYHVSTLSEIAHEPLGAVASRLRSELGRDRLRRRTQALVTYQHNQADKGGLSVTADANPSTDIMLSSWAKVGCWEYDFGFGLGKPDSVRRPLFEPFESLMYLMPKRPDGEITAALSLRNEDMERLKGDEEWKKRGRFIG